MGQNDAPALIYGPTYEEMRDPTRIDPAVRAAALEARKSAPLDPVCLFDLGWHEPDGTIAHVVVPQELHGQACQIAMLTGRRYPTGSHKVGPAYSIVVEKQIEGECRPGEHDLICPSTGNFGIGGAWVGPRMGYRSVVVMPEDMSAERYEKIASYGGECIKTPGSESNVKEIFDKVNELRGDPKNRIIEQFSEFANYRFHYEVTGSAVCELGRWLASRGIGENGVSAFVSAMGSAGTIAAADRVKTQFPGAATVGLEPVQCPTLYDVGFGSHRIEGIGDKHVTWIHNVLAMDLLCCIDELDCLRGLQLVQEGAEVLAAETGLDPDRAAGLAGIFGVSGICNLLGAIKTARWLGLGPRDLVVTVATDGFDRYPSVLQKLTREEGPQTREAALRRLDIFHRQRTDWVLEGSPAVQRRWHNQKYFTWVEQQGKSVEELDALGSDEFWEAQRARVRVVDAAIRAIRPAGVPSAPSPAAG